MTKKKKKEAQRGEEEEEVWMFVKGIIMLRGR